ncbi:hypothetical protein [Mesorhizobium sp. IMUNJ 23232]|uniref:hypothetical protein n=1 Tax=Mesorhizobium sp. IMUNJ 23232 TaxID=3376064 RepID=UPI003793D480
MAQSSNGSLRIVPNAGSTAIHPQGYIELTEDYFAITDNNLEKIGKKNQAAIEFLKRNGARIVKDKLNRIIDKSTNKIKVMIDEDDDEDGKTRTHVSLPSQHLTSVGDLAYLDDYINIITNFADGTTAGSEKARKFLFGLMMITKCR